MTEEQLDKLSRAADRLDAALTLHSHSIELDRESAQTIVRHLYPYLHAQRQILALEVAIPQWRDHKHPNGAPMFSPVTGMMLDPDGNRCIFDDVDAQ